MKKAIEMKHFCFYRFLYCGNLKKPPKEKSDGNCHFLIDTRFRWLKLQNYISCHWFCRFWYGETETSTLHDFVDLKLVNFVLDIKFTW